MNSRPNQILSCDARKTARRLLEQGKTESEILDVVGDEWRGSLVTAREFGWHYWGTTQFDQHPIARKLWNRKGWVFPNRIQGGVI